MKKKTANKEEQPESGVIINTGKDVYELMKFLEDQDREHFYTLHLDVKNRIINKALISIGTLTSSIIHPREVFKSAIKDSSAQIICVHNHPSGDPTPSQDDKKITKRLQEAGELIGIPVLDHVIIGDGHYYSFDALKEWDTEVQSFHDSDSLIVAQSENDSGRFDPADICSIADELWPSTCQLMVAEGMMNTYGHIENDPSMPDVRSGIAFIIHNHLTLQQEILDKYANRYKSSDVGIFMDAADTLQMVNQGAFTTKEAAADRIRPHIEKLKKVIERGGSLKDKTEALLSACNKHVPV